jgi:hypothetical protein
MHTSDGKCLRHPSLNRLDSLESPSAVKSQLVRFYHNVTCLQYSTPFSYEDPPPNVSLPSTIASRRSLMTILKCNVSGFMVAVVFQNLALPENPSGPQAEIVEITIHEILRCCTSHTHKLCKYVLVQEGIPLVDIQ